MKKIFKLKKGEKVFNKDRKEIINYINKVLLDKGTNELNPVFRKDIEVLIEIK